MTSTIIFDISGHGYGHLAQIAPLVRLVIERKGVRDVIVRSPHDAERAERIIGVPGLRTVPPPPDPGLVMHGPVQVDVEATLRKYGELHEALPQVIENEARRLERLGAALLISDVGHVGPAAAARAGIPSFALCSLHWEEILAACLPDTPEVRRIRDGIVGAYDEARAFLLAAPRQSVPRLARVVPIGPMVRGRGRSMREFIRRQLGVRAGTRLCYVTFGGIGGTQPCPRLPGNEEWAWIFAGRMPHVLHAGRMFPGEKLTGLDALDLIASCDLVLTKTGYGTFMECVAHGTPCAFLSRPDWPEAADLEEWLTASGIGKPVTASMLVDGSWLEAARSLRRARPRPEIFTGALDALAVISRECGSLIS